MQIASEYLTDRKGGFASGVGTSINRTACDINRDIITWDPEIMYILGNYIIHAS